MRRLVLISAMLLLLSTLLCAARPAGRKSEVASAPRNLTGIVFDKAGHAVPDAVVYLKNIQSLAIYTYITAGDGSYRFNNLSTDIDYQVHAQFGGHKSEVKTLSSFDARKQPHINLKLDR